MTEFGLEFMRLFQNKTKQSLLLILHLPPLPFILPKFYTFFLFKHVRLESDDVDCQYFMTFSSN